MSSNSTVLAFYSLASVGSMVTSLVVILAYGFVPRLRSFSVGLLFSLAIIDLIHSINHFLPSSGGLCFIQGLIEQYTLLSSICYVLSVSLNAYFSIKGETILHKYKFIYQVLGLGVPTALTIPVLFSGNFSSTELYCWISPNYPGLRLFCYYIPLFILYAAIITLFIAGMRKLIQKQRRAIIGQLESRELSINNLNDSIVKLEVHYVSYIIAFCFIKLPEFIFRTQEDQRYQNGQTVTGNNFFLLSAAFLGSLQGVVNILLFFNNRSVRNYIRMYREDKLLLLEEQEGNLFPLQQAMTSTRALKDPEQIIQQTKIDLNKQMPQHFEIQNKPLYSDAELASSELSVFIGSWNLGNKIPPESLNEWLPCNTFYDLIIVGAQEAFYEINKTLDNAQKIKRLITGESDDESENHWFNLIHNCIGESNYTRVLARSIGHIRLIVLVRNNLASKVSNICVNTETAGLGNIYHNKGGVGISLKLFDLNLAFVCVHLAALDRVHQRNDDAMQILERLKLGVPDNLNCFHSLFFLGDLNYRVKASKREILEWINQEKINLVLAQDELYEIMKKNILYYGFHEAEIHFPPTYKYLVPKIKKNNKRNKLKKLLQEDLYNNVNDIALQVNSKYKQNYEAQQQEENKAIDQMLELQAKSPAEQIYTLKRTPAWCDRILYHNRNNINIQQTYYDHVKIYKTSDHKPIKAGFIMSFKQLNTVNESLGKNIASPARMDDEKRNYAMRTECHEFQIVLKNLQVFDCVNPHSFPLLQPFMTFKSNYFDSNHDFHSGVADLADNKPSKRVTFAGSHTTQHIQQDPEEHSEIKLDPIDYEAEETEESVEVEINDEHDSISNHTNNASIDAVDEDEQLSPKKKSKPKSKKKSKKSKSIEDEDEYSEDNLPANPPSPEPVPSPPYHEVSTSLSEIPSGSSRSLHVRSPSAIRNEMVFPQYQDHSQLICSFTSSSIPPLHCDFNRVSVHSTASDVLFQHPYKRSLLTFSRSQLTIILRDRSWIGDKDYIGVSSIELAAGCNDEPVNFITPILTHTKYNGFLVGSIQILSNTSNNKTEPLILPLDLNDRDKLHSAHTVNKNAKPKSKSKKQKASNNNINSLEEDLE